MPVFYDDFIQLPNGQRITCDRLGFMDWPPPEKITIDKVNYTRHSYSSLTNKQRSATKHITRGARYKEDTA